MSNRKWIGLLCIVELLCILVAPGVVSADVFDTVPPDLQRVSFTPSSIDVANAAPMVSVTVRLTDAPAGADCPDFSLLSPSRQTHGGFLSFNNPVSGEASDGPYTFSINSQRLSHARTWRVLLFARDKAGHHSVVWANDLANRGFPSVLMVNSGRHHSAGATVFRFLAKVD